MQWIVEEQSTEADELMEVVTLASAGVEKPVEEWEKMEKEDPWRWEVVTYKIPKSGY